MDVLQGSDSTNGGSSVELEHQPQIPGSSKQEIVSVIVLCLLHCISILQSCDPSFVYSVHGRVVDEIRGQVNTLHSRLPRKYM